ncbi:MAG: hypothetical protein NZ903_02765 [Candidatus Micrarchaeota archaeon]|nr:hypothetical protein [Candidatus Micrarchaeota archaeon]
MDIGVGEKIESEKRTNERRENRFWKAAKIGIVAIGLAAAFGKSLKAEESIKTPFIKEIGENGTAIEYNYKIGDDDYKVKVENEREVSKNKEYEVSIRTQGIIFGRTFIGIEGELWNRNRNSKYASNGYQNQTEEKEKIEKEKRKILIDGGFGIAPDGINDRIKIGFGYGFRYIEENINRKNYSYRDNFMAQFGEDANGDEIILVGNNLANGEIKENADRTEKGSEISARLIIGNEKLGAAPVIKFGRWKGWLDYNFYLRLQSTLRGDLLCGPNHQPCMNNIVIESVTEGMTYDKIQTKTSEISLSMPVVIGNNLIGFGFVKEETKYVDNLYYYGIDSIITKTYEIYYKRKIIESIAARIGYTHTIEKIMKMNYEEERHNNALNAGIQIKF